MKKTRIGTIVLVLCMVFALALPVTAFADDKDFTVVITDADGVSGEPIQVDAAELAEQLADVSGKTVSITLNKNVDAGNTPLNLPADGAYTLDLGEYTLTSNGDTVSNYGELIIQGSGTITSAGGSTGALVNYPGAEATAMSGKLVANTWYAVKNMGTMTLGGEVEVTTENPNASLIANGWYGSTATDRYTEYCANDAVLNITGGNFAGGMNTVKNDDRGVLTIENGTFSNTQGAAILNWHKATINGGDFSVSDNSHIVLGNGYLPGTVEDGEAAVAVDAGELVINGGSFQAAPGGILLGYGESTQVGGSLKVTGGSFDGDFGADSYYYEIAIENCAATQKVPDSMLAEGSGGLAMYGDNGAQFFVGKPADLADKVSGAQSGTTVEIYAGDVALETVPEGVSVQVDGGAATVVIDGKTYSVVTLQAATCTKAGVNRYTNVADSTDTFYRSVPASHKWDAGVVTKPATCGEDGEKVYTCTVCQAEKKATIAATGEHQYDDKVIDATCTEPAMAGEVCTVCGAVNGEMEAVGEPLGHNYVLDEDAEGTVAATCTTDGIAVSVCSRCKDTKQETVAALGHEWDTGVVHEDCEGQYVLYTCTREGCGETKKEYTGVGEVTEHEWVKNEEDSTAATCTVAGETVYTCSKCGATKTEEVPALGHDMVATVVPPTCADEGYTEHKCSRCDYTEENTDIVPADPDAHVAGEEGIVLKEATCTTAGVKKVVCKYCDASMGYEAIPPSHTWDDGEVKTAATCTEPGEMLYTCEVCKETKTEVIPATDHNWGEGVVTTEPTCGKDGVMTYTCSVCQETKTEPIPATGKHDYQEDVIPATCTEPAMAGKVCTVCGAAEGELKPVEGSEPLGHDWELVEDAEDAVAATCTTDGLAVSVCRRCEDTKQETVPALGHKWDKGVVHDDCEGQYVLYTCETCSETYTELTGLGEVTEHEWVKNEEDSTAATCTVAGETVYTCSKCGATKTEEVPALGHDMVATVVPPTCADEGYTEHKCSRCDYTEENTDIVPADPDAHVAGEEGIVLKEATCTTAGVKKVVCKYCDASMGYEAIPPSHTWDDGEVKTAATCTEPGEMLYTCEVCKETKTEVIPATDHKWGEGEVTQEPTCGADGVRTYTCSACQETKTEPIPATDKHDYQEDVIEATCTEPAKVGMVCTGCGAAKGELTPVEGSEPLGHDWELDETAEDAVAATCTTDGIAVSVCNRCGEVMQKPVPALGHKWDDGVLVDDCEGQYVLYTCQTCGETYKELTGLGEVTEHEWVKNEEDSTAATCTVAGETVYTCSKCGATKTEEVPALGHDMVATVVPPTCADEGYTEHKCSRCDYTEENTDIVPADPDAHVAGEEGIVLKEATCTTAGVKKVVCALCDASMGYEAIPPSHTWDAGEVKTAATCTEPGETLYTCEACEETKTEVTPATGHDWGEGEVTQEPTCGADGVRTYTCSACQETKTEPIPATDKHDYQEDVIEATCTEPAKVGMVCTGCGAVNGELTPVAGSEPLGHDYKLDPDAEGAVAVTCTTDGIAVSVCSRCEDTKQETVPAPGHKWNKGEVFDDCEGQYVLYTCQNCGETYKEYTGLGEVTEHDWVRDESTLTATCTEAGTVEETCSKCGAKRTVEVAALGHDVVATVVPPTCQSEGYTEHKCSRCDYAEENTDIVPIDPNAHDLDYDNAHVLKEATCAEPGVIRVTCKLCGKHVYESTTAEHSWDDGTVTKQPTCTEEGEIEFTCTVCEATKTEPIDKLEHVWSEEKVKDDGVTIYRECTLCHEEEILGIVGHEHQSEVIPGVPATCTEAGLTEGEKCSVCGEILVAQEEIPALGHTEEVLPAVAATCTEAGLTEGKKCSVCGEILVAQEEIPALGHTEEVIPAVPATCTEAGLTEGKQCSVCGEILEEQEVIPALGHTEEVLPGVPATCTEDGLTEGQKCSVCGEVLVEQEVIPALGHTEVEVPEVPATETEPGTTAGTKCSVCGEILSGCEVIPATGHIHQYVATVTAPTCTEGGYTTYTCACGDSYVADETPATGHDYKLVSTTFNSDYTKVTYTYECANCGDSYTQELDV